MQSLGATKKQVANIIIKEGTILLVISIFIGVFLSIILAQTIVKYIDRNISSQITINILSQNVLYFCIDILLIVITVYIAILISTTKIFKNTIIDSIKNNYNKSTYKIKSNKPIEKVIAIKNFKQNNSKYKMVVLTVMLSVILLLTTNGYISNVYRKSESIPDNYIVQLYKPELIDDITKQFNQTGYINSISIYNEMQLWTSVPKENISKSIRNAIEKMPELKNKIFETTCELIALREDSYKKYLQDLGLKELEEDECIYVNYDDSVKTKYYDGIDITNYKVNDKIEIYLQSKKSGYSNVEISSNFNSLNNLEYIEYGDNQEKVELKIANISTRLPKGIKRNSNTITPVIYIIVNEDTFNNTYFKLYNIDKEKDEYRIATTLSINSSNRELLDKELEQIAYKHNIANYELASTMYIDDGNNKVQKKQITQLILYTLIVFIMIITIINIANVVINDINFRQGDFAILKAIGMDKKQFNKMLFSEYFKYIGTATVLGIAISIFIIYTIYILTEDYQFYNFQIPYIEIMFVIISVIILLKCIIKYTNKKINKNSIIKLINE